MNVLESPVGETVLDQSQRGIRGAAEADMSVVSRTLKADEKALEELIRSQGITEGAGAAAKDDPWDKGHWANRQ